MAPLPVLASLLVLASLCGVRAAAADYLSLLPSAQPALDLKDVPVGVWGEYRHVRPGGVDRQRFVLVGDTPDGRLLEVTVESEAFRKPVVFRFVVPRQPRPPSALSPFEMQVGDERPIRAMLPQAPLFADFLSPRARTGTRPTKVDGRPVNATVYRHELGADSWEYWVSAAVPPLGFVRSTKRIGGTTSTLELLRFGKGGVGRMQGGPREVDGAAVTRALTANLRAGPTK